MSFNYAIVIVTYNRKELLKECLEHALNQTFQAEKVIVINNNSNDGTAEVLKSYQTKNDNLLVYNEKSNIGGAGGFHDGIKAAMKHTKCEWFMLIDDDAILEYNCMEKMFSNVSPEYEAYATKVLRDGKIEEDRQYRFGKKVKIDLYNEKIFNCESATFCGLMISRKLVKKIGYPVKEYFIWFDDIEYCLRFHNITDIAVIPEAILNHKTKLVINSSGHDVISWKSYYGLRNGIDAYRRNRYYLRYLYQILENFGRIVARLIRSVPKGNFKETISDCTIIFDGTVDGMRRKLGKNPKYLPG